MMCLFREPLPTPPSLRRPERPAGQLLLNELAAVIGAKRAAGQRAVLSANFRADGSANGSANGEADERAADTAGIRAGNVTAHSATDRTCGPAAVDCFNFVFIHLNHYLTFQLRDNQSQTQFTDSTVEG